MDPKRWQRVKEVFHSALELPPEDRSAYLDRECAEDSELRAEVERLLGEQPRAASFLESPPVVEGLDSGLPPHPDGDPQDQPPVPRQIGKYRIIDVLGQGGMGIVYRAEQDSPRRTVALKVIQAGRASTQLLKRFEHESQVLGRLQHPGIAQIFEAGTADTAAGPQPFFAMELIRGRPLVEFADAQNLGTRQRLELLIKICDAVQHAHIKGVIHRDLKPGNILVDDTGQPKVLDFGVARVTDADLQVTTAQTDVGQLIGTLPYMSPEQVTGDPAELDTRSDVYALGVMAYELLAGRLPYDLGRRVIAEAARVIREEEPTPLSSVNKVFRGDLETIVSKALEKDKARRYQAATDLGEDLSRYLRDEPIVARPASAFYQLRKFARRNKALAGGVAVAFVALVLGLAVTSAALVRAVRSDRLAAQRLAETQREARKAEAVKEFLQDMLASVDPSNAKGPEVTVREILDEAARELESGSLAEQEEVEAAVRTTVGDTYAALGLYPQAEPHLRAALEINRRLYGPEHSEVAWSLKSWGLLQLWKGDYAQAEAAFREALAMDRRLWGRAHADLSDSLNNLGIVLSLTGDYAAAEPLFREALDMDRELLGAEHPDLATGLNNLADLLYEKGDYAAAEPMLRQALAITKKAQGPDHPDVAHTLKSLARLKLARGEFAEAESLYRQDLAIERKWYGSEHPQLASTLNSLGVVLKYQGKLDEAEPLFREALEMNRKLLGEEHQAVAASMNNLAGLLQGRGDYAGAEPLLRKTLAVLRQVFGEEHPHIATALHNLAACYHRQGDYAKAEPLYLEALAMRRKLLGDEHPEVAKCMVSLGTLAMDMGDHERAESLFRPALSIFRRAVGDHNPNVVPLLQHLGDLAGKRGDVPASEKAFREAAAIQRTTLAEDDPSLADTMVGLGEVLLNAGRIAEAEAAFREALEVRVRVLPAGHPETAQTKGALGMALMSLDRYAEAEPLFLESYQVLLKELGADDELTATAIRRLVSLYEAWGRPDRADEYRALLGEAAAEPSDTAP